MTITATTVGAYLRDLPPDRRVAMARVCSMIRRSARGVRESMRYGLAFYELDGPLFALESGRRHMSLFGWSLICMPPADSAPSDARRLGSDLRRAVRLHQVRLAKAPGIDAVLAHQFKKRPSIFLRQPCRLGDVAVRRLQQVFQHRALEAQHEVALCIPQRTDDRIRWARRALLTDVVTGDRVLAAACERRLHQRMEFRHVAVPRMCEQPIHCAWRQDRHGASGSFRLAP